MGGAGVSRSRPVTSDPERLAELQRRVKQAEAKKRNLVAASGVGGTLGQNAMREGDVIRISWDELRNSQRDAAKIVSRVIQLGGEACAQISVKFDGKYLPVFINFRLNFQYEAEAGHLGGGGGSGHPGGGGGGDRSSESEGDYGDDEDERAGHWPLDAYTMVFASRSDALAWTSWYRDRADPASPAVARRAAATFSQEEKNLVEEMDYLAAMRCRVSRALILQENAWRTAHVAACLMGAPMVTQGLQDNNIMLQKLVGATDAPEALLVKIDTRGARAALLEYVNVAERVLTSPALSYFLGANRVMRKALAEIRTADRASGGMLDARGLELLREVNTWLAVSETCITRSLYRLIQEQDGIAEIKRVRREERAVERAKARERDRWRSRSVVAAGGGGGGGGVAQD